MCVCVKISGVELIFLLEGGRGGGLGKRFDRVGGLEEFGLGFPSCLVVFCA